MGWESIPTPMPAGEADSWELVAAPTSPARLYAFRTYPQHEGVYRSLDGGASWQRLADPPGAAGFGAAAVVSLAIDPHDPRRLLAGTATRGVFTWTEP
jgi:hypothetical protein